MCRLYAVSYSMPSSLYCLLIFFFTYNVFICSSLVVLSAIVLILYKTLNVIGHTLNHYLVVAMSSRIIYESKKFKDYP